MEWQAFVDAAQATSWITYLATVDARGRPHVSVVAPGFTEGSIWFATRQSSRKFRNLTKDPTAAFHWPVGGEGPGELIAQGEAQLFTSADDRRGLWESGVLSYDPVGFWGTPDNEDLAFVQVEVASARLLGPDFVPDRWIRPTRPPG